MFLDSRREDERFWTPHTGSVVKQIATKKKYPKDERALSRNRQSRKIFAPKM
jgi:hypothetical protein